MYILMALGFAFLFSIMRIINFAHGVIYMIGGYICYELIATVGLNHWLALVATAIIVGAFGIFLERFCFRPFWGNFNRTIVVCIGIIIVLENLVSLVQGYEVQRTPSFVPGIVDLGITSVSWERLVILFLGVILLILVLLFVNKTKPGLQMQATAQDSEGAALQGISIYGMSRMATVIACALAGIAGGLMGSYLSLTAYMGTSIMLKILAILVLGGIGSIKGIMLAGLIIGTLDAFLPTVLTGPASEAVTLGVVVVLLLFRPQGFFGQEVRF